MGERCGAYRRATRRQVVGAAVVGTGATVLGFTRRLSDRVAAQDRDYRIVLIPGEEGGNFFYIPMACGAQAAAAEAGVTLKVVTPEAFDPAVQVPVLESVIESQPDAILIVPTDRTALIAPIQAAVDAGIAVFTLDTAIDADLALANIASDNHEGGRTAARALAEAIGERGKVFVINVVPGISSTDQREEGFATEIATYPDIEYLGQEFDDDMQDRAQTIVSDTIRQVPDLTGVFATNLPAGQGAALAVELSGAADRVAVVAFDAGPDQVDQLRAGTADALIAQHPYEMGSLGVEQAIAYLRTKQKPVEKQIATGFSVVTRDTLADPENAEMLYGLDCAEIPAATPAAP